MSNDFGRTMRTLLTCATLGGALAGAAWADGIDPVYSVDGVYMDDIEIMGDVRLPDGKEYAMLEMRNLNMRFYIDPDAIYVMMEDNNPILVNDTPFNGYWVSTVSLDVGNWPGCDYYFEDHEGFSRRAFGNVTWTNTGIADNGYELEFLIDIGTCNSATQGWGVSRAALQMTAPPTAPPVMPVGRRTIEQARETCGNEDDLTLRALGCSDMIAHPDATPGDVTWAHWGRAYVRCERAPDQDVIADLVVALRQDTKEYQGYFQRVGTYSGPIDGVLRPEIFDSVTQFVEAGCRSVK